MPLEVRADWNDISAAVSRAAPLAAVAPVSTESVGQGEPGSTARVSLISIDDQPAAVIFRVVGEDPSVPGPVAIEIDAEFGTPNNAERAGALAALIAEQMRALAGRAVAPL